MLMNKELWRDFLLNTDLIGNSPEMGQIRKLAKVYGKSDQHVLIMGEAGTEKIDVAANIHAHSPRKDQLTIITDASRLNAAYDKEIWGRIRSTLKEEELSSGKISGTLVVENIEELKPEIQKNLLILAKRGYLTDPNSGNPLETDFRFFATAQPKIHEMLQDEHFDSELFLSLSELAIKLPPLRDRKQDLALLSDHFLHRICAEAKRETPPINFEVFNQMLKHDWHGNVKELENVVRSLVMSSPVGELMPEALPFYDNRLQFNKLELQSLGLAVAQLEKELIEKALRRFAGNQSRAAQILGLSEPNLRFKMKKLGIKKNDFVMGTR